MPAGLADRQQAACRGEEGRETLARVSSCSLLPVVYNSVLIACGLWEGSECISQGRLGEEASICEAKRKPHACRIRIKALQGQHLGEKTPPIVIGNPSPSLPKEVQ